MTETGSLWAALGAAIHDENHEAVSNRARALLSVDEGDDLAAHCLLVSTLQLDNLTEAQSLLNQHPTLLPITPFERSYLLYRQRQLQQALDLLETLLVDDDRSLQLRALISSRLGQAETAATIYKSFLDKFTDNDDGTVYHDELLSNYLAVCAPEEAQRALKEIPRSRRTFTMIYNGACGRIAVKDWAGAERMLRQSLDMCKNADLSHDDLLEELAPIQIQLAYVRQVIIQSSSFSNIFRTLRFINELCRHFLLDARIFKRSQGFISVGFGIDSTGCSFTGRCRRFHQPDVVTPS